MLASESSTSLEFVGVTELEGGGEDLDGVINGVEGVTTEVSLGDCSMVVSMKEVMKDDIGINITRMGVEVCN